MKANLKNGDVFFVRIPLRLSRPLTLVSWCIRKVLGTWYNHIGVYVELFDSPFVAESTLGGVKVTPYKEWAKDYEIAVKRNPKLSRQFTKRLMRYQGHTPYDTWSLVWDQLILQLTGKWVGKKKEAAKDKLYCSEYYALCDVENFPEWWKTTPEDIYNKEGFDTIVERSEAKRLIFKL
jgi:uncharacterized protein YycO